MHREGLEPLFYPYPHDHIGLLLSNPVLLWYSTGQPKLVGLICTKHKLLSTKFKFFSKFFIFPVWYPMLLPTSDANSQQNIQVRNGNNSLFQSLTWNSICNLNLFLVTTIIFCQVYKFLCVKESLMSLNLLFGIPLSSEDKATPCTTRLHHVQLFVSLWTIACQVPLSMGLSRQEWVTYWVGHHFLLQWIFSTQGSNPHLWQLLH